MGNIVGGLIGGVGSLLGGKSAKSNALTGYNYLAGNKANQAAQGAVAPALAGQTSALENQAGAVAAESAPIAQQGQAAAKQAGIGDTMTDLLTGNRASPALNNYLNSSGFKFQLDQGTRALAGSAATRGLLGSGSTAKGIAGFSSGLSGNYFKDYLTQLGGAANVQGGASNSFGNTAASVGNQAQGYGGVATGYGSQAKLGVDAANQVAQAGTEGGKPAGDAMQSGTTGLFGKLAGAAGSILTGGLF